MLAAPLLTFPAVLLVLGLIWRKVLMFPRHACSWASGCNCCQSSDEAKLRLLLRTAHHRNHPGLDKCYPKKAYLSITQGVTRTAGVLRGDTFRPDLPSHIGRWEGATASPGRVSFPGRRVFHFLWNFVGRCTVACYEVPKSTVESCQRDVSYIDWLIDWLKTFLFKKKKKEIGEQAVGYWIR